MALNNIPQITFDESAIEFILDAFDKSIDSEGFIVEKRNPKQRVLTPEGEEIQSNDLGAIKKGSELYIKKDLSSILKLSKRQY